MKYAKRKGDPKVKCLLVTKIERWVGFLDSKKAENKPDFSPNQIKKR